METNQPWKWRLTVPKTVKMMLVRPPMTKFKMTVSAECMLFLHIASSFPLWKLLAPVCQGNGGGVVSLWTGICPHPTPQLFSTKIKQTFVSTSLASLLAFDQHAARPYFQFTDGVNQGIMWTKLEDIEKTANLSSKHADSSPWRQSMTIYPILP